MYPTLYHAFLDLFGIDMPWMKMLNSFGFFVAIAFIVGSMILSRELKRREMKGELKAEKRKITVGLPPSIGDIITNGVLGFILGWKFIYLILNSSRLFQPGSSPQRHIFSMEGYWLVGILIGGAMAYWRYREMKKQQLPAPLEKEITFHVYEYTGTITFLAAIFGIIGAKLFHLFENPREFVQFFTSPDLESFLSGLTVYGGLILGSAAALFFAWKKGIPLLSLCDAAAPSMILSYGIGRIGCQVSGDGDWGIVNSASKPSWLSWAPDWLWAYDYPNNVNGVGTPLIDGSLVFEGYGTHLPQAVFPTPFYETLMTIAIFAILWAVRKRIRIPGVLMALYLFLNGFERFWIERIRVNNKFDLLGIQATQAQVISVIFMLAGIGMALYLRRRWRKMNAVSAH